MNQCFHGFVWVCILFLIQGWGLMLYCVIIVFNCFSYLLLVYLCKLLCFFCLSYKALSCFISTSSKCFFLTPFSSSKFQAMPVFPALDYRFSMCCDVLCFLPVLRPPSSKCVDFCTALNKRNAVLVSSLLHQPLSQLR